MRQVNIHACKTQLSRLVDQAASGEEIVIAKAGKPVARLVPLAPPAPRRKFGGWKGKLWIAEDFDAALPPEVLTAFLGGDKTGPQRP